MDKNKNHEKKSSAKTDARVEVKIDSILLPNINSYDSTATIPINLQIRIRPKIENDQIEHNQQVHDNSIESGKKTPSRDNNEQKQKSLITTYDAGTSKNINSESICYLSNTDDASCNSFTTIHNEYPTKFEFCGITKRGGCLDPIFNQTSVDDHYRKAIPAGEKIDYRKSEPKITISLQRRTSDDLINKKELKTVNLSSRSFQNLNTNNTQIKRVGKLAQNKSTNSESMNDRFIEPDQLVNSTSIKEDSVSQSYYEYDKLNSWSLSENESNNSDHNNVTQRNIHSQISISKTLGPSDKVYNEDRITHQPNCLGPKLLKDRQISYKMDPNIVRLSVDSGKYSDLNKSMSSLDNIVQNKNYDNAEVDSTKLTYQDSLIILSGVVIYDSIENLKKTRSKSQVSGSSNNSLKNTIQNEGQNKISDETISKRKNHSTSSFITIKPHKKEIVENSTKSNNDIISNSEYKNTLSQTDITAVKGIISPNHDGENNEDIFNSETSGEANLNLKIFQGKGSPKLVDLNKYDRSFDDLCNHTSDNNIEHKKDSKTRKDTSEINKSHKIGVNDKKMHMLDTSKVEDENKKEKVENNVDKHHKNQSNGTSMMNASYQIPDNYKNLSETNVIYKNNLNQKNVYKNDILQLDDNVNNDNHYEVYQENEDEKYHKRSKSTDKSNYMDLQEMVNQVNNHPQKDSKSSNESNVTDITKYFGEKPKPIDLPRDSLPLIVSAISTNTISDGSFDSSKLIQSGDDREPQVRYSSKNTLQQRSSKLANMVKDQIHLPLISDNEDSNESDKSSENKMNFDGKTMEHGKNPDTGTYNNAHDLQSRNPTKRKFSVTSLSYNKQISKDSIENVGESDVAHGLESTSAIKYRKSSVKYEYSDEQILKNNIENADNSTNAHRLDSESSIKYQKLSVKSDSFTKIIKHDFGNDNTFDHKHLLDPLNLVKNRKSSDKSDISFKKVLKNVLENKDAVKGQSRLSHDKKSGLSNKTSAVNLILDESQNSFYQNDSEDPDSKRKRTSKDSISSQKLAVKGKNKDTIIEGDHHEEQKFDINDVRNSIQRESSFVKEIFKDDNFSSTTSSRTRQSVKLKDYLSQSSVEDKNTASDHVDRSKDIHNTIYSFDYGKEKKRVSVKQEHSNENIPLPRQNKENRKVRLNLAFKSTYSDIDNIVTVTSIDPTTINDNFEPSPNTVVSSTIHIKESDINLHPSFVVPVNANTEALVTLKKNHQNEILEKKANEVIHLIDQNQDSNGLDKIEKKNRKKKLRPDGSGIEIIFNGENMSIVENFEFQNHCNVTDKSECQRVEDFINNEMKSVNESISQMKKKLMMDDTSTKSHLSENSLDIGAVKLYINDATNEGLKLSIVSQKAAEPVEHLLRPGGSAIELDVGGKIISVELELQQEINTTVAEIDSKTCKAKCSGGKFTSALKTCRTEKEPLKQMIDDMKIQVSKMSMPGERCGTNAARLHSIRQMSSDRAKCVNHKLCPHIKGKKEPKS